MTVKYSRRKSKLMKILSAVLCLCLMVPLTGTTQVKAADSIAEKQAELDKLTEQKQELSAKMDELKTNEAEKVQYQATLEQQISTVIAEMTATRGMIEELDKKILETQTKLDKAKEEMDDTINLFYARVKALYMGGSTQMSTLQVLLNADSLHDFSMKVQMMDSINEHDSQIMKKIEDYMTATESDRTLLQKDQADLAERKKDLDRQSAELNELNAENNKALAEISDLKNATQQQMDEVDEDSAAIDAELNRMIEEENERQRQAEEARRLAEQQNSGGYGGDDSGGGPSRSEGGYVPGGDNGGWRWPLPGGTVTQNFGGYSGTHGGVDISRGGGNPIVATKPGKVIAVVDYWTPSMGTSDMASYGNYVLVWHDYTYSTRYAHMSSVSVSEGDEVVAGQVLGIEGNTGNSFGAHLHFEVIENGSRVNPRNYIG